MWDKTASHDIRTLLYQAYEDLLHEDLFHEDLSHEDLSHEDLSHRHDRRWSGANSQVTRDEMIHGLPVVYRL